MFVLHHILFCQKQAFCCSFAFSSSLWINSKSISSAVWRGGVLTVTAQSWEYPFWNLFTLNPSDWIWMVKRFWVWVVLFFYCLILSNPMFFVLEYCNLILFLPNLPLPYWEQKVFLSPIPQVWHSKILWARQLEAVFDSCDLYLVIYTRF